MDKLIAGAKFIYEHYQEILGSLSALLLAFIGVFSMIPGDQPEKTLQKIVDFIAKFSKKPEEPKA